MKSSLCLLMSLVVTAVMAFPATGRAKPASRVSVEWATANSDRVIVGKVIKAGKIGKHDIVTVEVRQTLRGDHEWKKAGDLHPTVTFVAQEYCSGYANGWLEDGLPMIFFLVNIDAAER